MRPRPGSNFAAVHRPANGGRVVRVVMLACLAALGLFASHALARGTAPLDQGTTTAPDPPPTTTVPNPDRAPPPPPKPRTVAPTLPPPAPRHVASPPPPAPSPPPAPPPAVVTPAPPAPVVAAAPPAKPKTTKHVARRPARARSRIEPTPPQLRVRHASVARAVPQAAAPIAVEQDRSASRWMLFLFLAFAVAAVGAAALPAIALPPPLARTVEPRRFEIAIAGVAVGVGVGVSVLLTVLLS
jgi:hypothetical protein